jgi:trehalose 6-phosphate synthase/phosphatase
MEDAGSFRTLQKPRHLSGSRLETALEKHKDAGGRLFLLDYDGTLVPFASTPEGAAPDNAVLELLRELNSDPHTRVVIVSGRDASTLEEWLGETGVELVAEHGGMRFDAETREWRAAEEAYSEEWKVQLRPIFEVFVDRTPGSMLEEKGAALVWHFRRADPDMGALRAAELTDALEGQIANTPLHILHGHKVVEVKPSGVSKGKAIQPWLIAEPLADFVLTAGDDVTDEALFEAVGDLGYTVKVGVPGRSKAKYYVNSPFEMRSLLSAFLSK